MVIDIRRYHPLTDESYLYESWMLNYRVGNCPSPIKNIGQRKRINRILKDTANSVYIACFAEDPDLILGYIVVNESLNALHWLYVKNKYRKSGIATALLGQLDLSKPVMYSHRSPDIWVEKKLKEDATKRGFIYNPYLNEPD